MAAPTMNTVRQILPYACRICGAAFQFEIRPLACPRCGGDNALSLVDDVDENSAAPSKKSKAQKDAVKIGHLVIEPFEPYSSGVPSFDRVVGGLSKGFSIFICGDKGVGKSTLITTIAAKHCLKVNKKGRVSVDETKRVFLASAEEPLQRFLARCERLGFLVTDAKGVVQETTATKHFVEIFKTRFVGSRESDIVRLHQQIRKHKPTLIIYDSIRKFTHPNVKKHSFLIHGPEVVGEIVYITEELKCCAIMIARLTKDGKMAGAEDMGYDADAVCLLSRHKPKKTTKTAKVKGVANRYVKLSCSKNRMGSDTRIGWFRMTGRGMISVPRPGKTKPKPVGAPPPKIRRKKRGD